MGRLPDPLGLNERLDEMDETVDEGRGEQPGTRDERLEALPEHELDDDRTVGGGVAAAGGTAIDRGTGTLEGRAEGHEPDDDVDEGGGPWTG